MDTLGDSLPKEIERAQGIAALYDTVPMGFITAGLMRNDIKAAHKAMIEGDVVAMLSSYKALQEWKDE